MDFEDVKRKAYEEISRAIVDNRSIKDLSQSNCLHDNCQQCHGTGVKDTGGICIHMISCSCTKCRIF